ncbi:protein FAM228B-like isoform X4 [Octopus sinensis]|uniref:Protein FAM228B-like isoform X4 n=1 Tax=Octopus sinensis TaxID=2607531 RepID=A0A6P7TK77_9MOLL|nr:protein FAM228B-like isoform X4 [Octopus sinensis]
MPLNKKNEGVLTLHNKSRLETILHPNTQILVTTPSNIAVKESQNANLRDTEPTCCPPKFNRAATFNNDSKANNQPLPSEFIKLTINGADNENDVFDKKLQTMELSSEASHLRLNTLTSQPIIQRIAQSPSSIAVVESETTAPYTLLKTECTARKKKISHQKSSEFREFKETYDNLLKKEHEMKQEIHSKLNFNEMKKKKHQENIYRQWTKKVYNPLSKRLQENVQCSPWLFTYSKKREVYKNYLKYVNTKGCAYLDTVDPEEYSIYPYPNKVPAKVNVTEPDNPLHFTSQQYDEELQVILSLLTGKNYSRSDIVNLKLFSRPDSSSSRQKMDATKWLLMPENNILSTPRTASRRKIHAGRYNKSMLSESC